MGNFNFKSSGKKASVVRRDIAEIAIIPTIYGILTPVRLADSGLFVTSTSLTQQIDDNLKNLIMTNHGERLMLHNFGANLRPVLHEYSNADSFDNLISQRISDAVAKWMPYVVPQKYSTEILRGRNIIFRLTLVYDVPSLNVSDRRLTIDMLVN